MKKIMQILLVTGCVMLYSSMQAVGWWESISSYVCGAPTAVLDNTKSLLSTTGGYAAAMYTTTKDAATQTIDGMKKTGTDFAAQAILGVTAARAFGKVSDSLINDILDMQAKFNNLNNAVGFKNKAAFVQKAVDALKKVVEDLFKMWAAVEETIEFGVQLGAVDKGQLEVARKVQAQYATYIYMLLDFIAKNTPDLFYYFGDLEVISEVL